MGLLEGRGRPLHHHRRLRAGPYLRLLRSAHPGEGEAGPGTTRHLPVVKETIDNHMASEPDMPLWAGFSNNEIPVNLGKLLTGQDFNGDPKACMDAIAKAIDAAVTEAGL